ncbi:hypothetical protein AJ79_04706 [Helicocarpus griseus UAMH5409]|uniref:NACHT domain-containing protein n=1 Tax=Helicocarpus griseus UAMH5409 TaxID=1447875 RepID=A0A2B7XSE0_9EURO|nr:hypothetical protein AJ79_04706 [Helicocarpus griseus UAMH5409]
MSNLDPDLYTVAWLAPLRIEAQAALHMLDKHHEGRFPIGRGDDYVFEAGEIFGHNVIIATLPAGQEYGTGAGAALASQVKKFFPNLWIGLLVGVAAGLPDFSKNPPRDIRLGDVLIALPEGESPGIIGYDLGKETGTDGFQLLHSGYRLANTESIVRSAIGSIRLRAPDESEAFLPYYEYMKDKPHIDGTFVDPGQEKDQLYQVGEDGVSQLVERQRRVASKRTRVWYGPIGSGEKLMKSAQKRNILRDKYNVIGLEMEAAGIMNRIPVGVIRGVCDYGDEYKNKVWQPYAAAMAAAFAKAVLHEITPKIKQLSPQSGELRDRFLQDICESDPYNEKLRTEEDKGGLLKDCYSWIFDDPQFLKWQNSKDDRLLWIKGEPGKGKTMLMIGVVDMLTDQLNGFSGLSYFFLQSSVPHLNNGVSVLRGLIWKLLFAYPHLQKYIPDEYGSKSKDAGKDLFQGPNTFPTLKMMLSSMLKDSSLETVYILVDALDECDRDLNRLIQWISRDAFEPLSKAKWLLSSRHTPVIHEIFRSESQRPVLILELTEKHTHRAVRRFIELKVEGLAKKKAYGDELHRNVEAVLISRAESTFLWAFLVCDRLDKIPRRKTMSELEKFPSGLGPFYDRMLRQIEELDEDDRDFCKQILRTVAACYRPLSLEELSSLVEVPEAEVDDVRDLVELCGSLLALRDQTIYFVHHSAKEYLLANSYVEEHGLILSRSLDIMSSVLRKDIYGLREPACSVDKVKLSKHDSLARACYSCFYWVDHLCQIDTGHENQIDFRDGGDIYLFLKTYFLYWLEALCLMGGVSGAVNMIQKLVAVFSPDQTPNLNKFVRDAERFISNHRGIIECAPLQIYSSALAFSPRASIVKRLFLDHIPTWIDHTPVVEENWSNFIQLLDHPEGVMTAAFTSDGRLATSGVSDHVVRLWDPSTGALIQSHKRDTEGITAVAFSSDNKVVSACDDQLIRFRDMDTGNLLRTIHYPSEVLFLAFSPNGEVLASGHFDVTIRLWDSSTGGLKLILEGHSIRISALSFSTDGTLLASASWDTTVRIWDPLSGDTIWDLQGHPEEVRTVVFSPNNRHVASGSSDGTIRLWDISTGELANVLEGHISDVMSVAFSPEDNNILASGSGDGTVRLWDISTRATISILTGHWSSVNAISFSDDGKFLASGSEDHTVRLWDPSLRTFESALEWRLGPISAAEFSLDGKIVASGSQTGMVLLWNADGEYTRLGELSEHVTALAISPDNKQVACGSLDGVIQIWDAAERCVILTLQEGDLEEADSQLDGFRLLPISALSFSLDGKFLAYGIENEDNEYFSIKIWDLSTGECAYFSAEESDIINALAFSSDGETLAAGFCDRTVRIWNLQTKDCIKCVVTPDKTNWLSFSGDGLSLETDQGIIELAFFGTSEIQYGPLRLPALSICGDWVVWQGEYKLWLPSDYRPVRWVVRNNTLALGLGSGRVVFLGFR